MKSQTVTPFFFYEFGQAATEPSRARAFIALARLAIEGNRLNEAEQLYRCAISEVEEDHGPDSKQVACLLEDMAELYERLGRSALALMYKRRARSIV